MTPSKFTSDKGSGEVERPPWRVNAQRGPGGETGRQSGRGERRDGAAPAGRQAAHRHVATARPPRAPPPPPPYRPVRARAAPGAQRGPAAAAPAPTDPRPRGLERGKQARARRRQVGRAGGSEERTCLTYLRPPQARVCWARDNGASAANTPRVSIRGCLLPTLARLRDWGGDTDGPERRTLPTVRALRARAGRRGPGAGGTLAGRKGGGLATFVALGQGRGQVAGTRPQSGERTIGVGGWGNSLELRKPVWPPSGRSLSEDSRGGTATERSYSSSALLLGPVEPGAAALALQTSTRLTLAAARIQASQVLT